MMEIIASCSPLSRTCGTFATFKATDEVVSRPITVRSSCPEKMNVELAPSEYGVRALLGLGNRAAIDDERNM